jgi:hypothetical protein
MMINVSLARQQLAALPGNRVQIDRAQLDALYAQLERGQRAILTLGDIASSAVAITTAGLIA